MALGKYNEGVGTGVFIKKYLAGGNRNLLTDSPIPGLAARKIQLLAAGDLTSAKNHQDVEMGPITGLPAGDVLGSFTEINATVDFLAFW